MNSQPDQIKPESEGLSNSDTDRCIALKILKLTFSALISNISQNIIETISFIVVGNLDDNLLISSIGFGFTWVFTFGYGILYGLSTGYSVYASQAFGASNYKMCGILLHRTIVILIIVWFCYGLMAFWTENILLTFGFDPELSYNVSIYAKLAIITMFFYAIHEALWFYLNAQNVVNYLLYMSIGSVIIHPFFAYLFIIKWNYGLAGAPLSEAATYFVKNLLILYYCIKINPYPETWISWTRESFENLFKYFKDLAINGAGIYLEMLTFESTSLNIAIFGDMNMFAGQSIALNFVYIMFQPNYNLTLASSIILGNAVGEGKSRLAKRIYEISSKLTFCLTTVIIILVLLLRKHICMIYTDESEMINYGANILLIYCLGFYGDITTNFLGFVLRTLGYENFVANAYIVSYYAIGIPLSFVFAHVFGFSYVGAWVGILLGSYIDSFISLRKVREVDWVEDVSKISSTVKNDNQFELKERLL